VGGRSISFWLWDFAAAVGNALPETAIVILSSNTDQRFIEEAKKVGAKAYVAKTELGTALVKAIESAVIGGDFVLME
jgi:DNA-binding NarL/FixJ family response regulator